MAIIGLDGFDLYNGTGTNTGLQSKWSSILMNGVSMQTGRFSGQCVRCVNSTSGISSSGIKRLIGSNATSRVFGFAYRTQTPTIDGGGWFSVYGDSGVTQHLVLRNNAANQIYVQRGSGGTTLGTSSACLVANTWHYLEVMFTIDDTVGAVTIKCDGVTVLTLTGVDTRNAGTTAGIDAFSLTYDHRTASGTYDYDDLYWTDSTTFLGERRIETLYPTSDVAQGFARSTGSTNYTLVDEATVNGDTDYVQGSTVGDVDTYGFGDLSSTPTTIDAVQINAFAEKTDATSRSIALQVKSGATTSDGSNFALASSYGKFERLLTTDPNTSGAWSASSVNALQGGPKVTV